jgi:SynChlorMet cassette protein ScmC
MFPMNIKKRIIKNNNGFSLRLANGQEWHLIPTKGTRSWVEKLASIMELKAGKPNAHPKLVFIQKESRKKSFEAAPFRLAPNIIEGLPDYGWKEHRLGTIHIWSHQEVPDVICEISPEKLHELEIIRMWMSLHSIYQRAQNSGGLPLHAALVNQNGNGIVLSAPGDTGKSTCCRRLPQPWQALCDDETLIVRDNQKRYFVHPFPTWSDLLWRRSERTWNVQHHLPLSAIFFLEQGESDKAVPIGHGEAAIYINESASLVCQRTWRNLDKDEERKLRKLLFQNACQLARAVPTFTLSVSLSGRFWKEIEKALYSYVEKENLDSNNQNQL